MLEDGSDLGWEEIFSVKLCRAWREILAHIFNLQCIFFDSVAQSAEGKDKWQSRRRYGPNSVTYTSTNFRFSPSMVKAGSTNGCLPHSSLSYSGVRPVVDKLCVLGINSQNRKGIGLVLPLNLFSLTENMVSSRGLRCS